MRGRFSIAVLAMAITTLIGGGAAPALTIDAFESGDFSFSDTSIGGTTSQEQSTTVLGGVRQVLLFLEGGTGSVSGDLTTTAGPDSATVSTSSNATGSAIFHYDGIADNNSQGSTGALNADLTAGGTLDRFLLEVTALSGFSGTIEIHTFDLDSNSAQTFSVSSTGSFTVPFGDFAGIDFSDVRTVRFRVLGLEGGESVSFGEFSAVPEPSAGLMIGTGLAWLAAHRRRRD